MWHLQFHKSNSCLSGKPVCQSFFLVCILYNQCWRCGYDDCTEAIERTLFFKTVIIVGKDIDLLVLLTELYKGIANIFIFKTGGERLWKHFTTGKVWTKKFLMIFYFCIHLADRILAFKKKGKIQFSFSTLIPHAGLRNQMPQLILCAKIVKGSCFTSS